LQKADGRQHEKTHTVEPKASLQRLRERAESSDKRQQVVSTDDSKSTTTDDSETTLQTE